MTGALSAAADFSGAALHVQRVKKDKKIQISKKMRPLIASKVTYAVFLIKVH